MQQTEQSPFGNVLLVDFAMGNDWQFLDGLRAATSEEWEVRVHQTNHLHGSPWKNLRRCLEYIFFPWTVLCGRRRYRRVVAWQQFFGVSLAFWLRLFHLPKRFDLTVMTFIYKPKRGALGRIYFRFMRYAVASRYVDRIVCYARTECRSYSRIFGVPEEKFVFLPLGVPEEETTETAEPEVHPESADYIFATGRSNRNYPLLLSVMRLVPLRKLRIACEEDLGVLPESVEVIHGCYGADMMQRLKASYLVAIPLSDPNISSGQLCALQAMQQGKPIVASRSAGLQDYLKDGETALLVDADAAAWSRAIERLYSDSELYARLSQNARQMYLQHYTERAMGENFAVLLSQKF